jgi:hypothetical protein
MKFSLYDAVRVKGIRLTPLAREQNAAFDLRSPRIGDIATIIEIYASPPGLELECSDDKGITQWTIAFPLIDVDLEAIA